MVCLQTVWSPERLDCELQIPTRLDSKLCKSSRAFAQDNLSFFREFFCLNKSRSVNEFLFATYRTQSKSALHPLVIYWIYSIRKLESNIQ